MSRLVQDAALTVSKALPAAGASNTCDAFEIGNGDSVEQAELEVSTPTLAALADDKSLTFELVTGSTSSPSTVLQRIHVLTGAGGAGVAATTKRVRIPSNADKYIAVKCTEDGSGGDVTGSSYTVKLLS
jgi:hypothetical protein